MTLAARHARLAIFMPSFRGGGAERVMVTLAREFDARGVAVDLVVAQDEGPNRPQATAGLRIVDLQARRVVLALPGLARYLRRAAPKVLLSALPHANVVAVWARALARGNARVVVSEHTTASLSAANARLLRGRLLPVFMRRAYRNADAIVAVSDGVANDLARVVDMDRSRITRIYNPIVSTRLAALAESTVDHDWFTNPGTPVVLAAGRLTPAKDFATLMRAVHDLRNRRRVRLMILGEGEERQALEALALELRLGADFALPGFIANPYAYMKRAAVFAVSSRWEGLGNVLVEAMACGAPVVSTDCPSGPREILEGGRHGLLVPVGDAPALARAIEASIDRPPLPGARTRAGDFGVESALESYADILGL